MPSLRIQSWDPGFGAEAALELEDQQPTEKIVDTEVELPLSSWRPLDAPDLPFEPIVFLDGVRRIDARALVEEGSSPPAPALLASMGAGLCICDERHARIEEITIRRLLLCHEPLDSLESPVGTYHFRPVPEEGLLGLMNGLRQALRDLEQKVAESVSGRHLTMADGPLSGTLDPGHNLVGYIKSHHTRYLTGSAEATLARLEPKQRTPLFLLESPWPRYSCYLRLPGSANSGLWSSLCRIELSAKDDAREAVERVERIAALLPRFASRPYREPRAPQNLFPIAGLEQLLRNRLGDAQLIYRRLR